MYGHRRSGSISGITLAVCLGLLFGVGFLIYDNDFTPRPRYSAPVVEPTRTPRPTLRPTLMPTLIPQPTLQPPKPREITYGATFFAPTAGINTTVIQSYLDGTSWDIANLGRYAGHLQGTAWMNEPGNIVLAGHVEMSDGRKGIFASIEDLRPGDPLILSQDKNRHYYAVKEILRVEADDLSVLYPSSAERLTLITCSNYDFLQDVYHERYVVVADRIS
jgi:LPXTG-site transpeptidase (sortase) family protein